MVRICISNCWEQEVDGEILLLGMKRLPAITGAVRNGGAARAHSKFGPGKGVCVLRRGIIQNVCAQVKLYFGMRVMNIHREREDATNLN